MKYIKQLDAIRALAVLLVVLSHWRILSSETIPIGGIGVDLFFVLSGFLITQILLENRKSIETTQDKKHVIKNFYIRRTLRIFPLYYATISAWFIIRWLSGDLTHDYLYYYAYVSNFHIYLHNAGGKLIPTWSLSVEEQFYLLWPWLMILVPLKRLFIVIVTFIFIGISSNYILCEILPHKNFIDWLTPTCFDSFGMGALLAYILTYRREAHPLFQKWIKPLAVLSLLILIGKFYMNLDVPIPVRTLVSFIGLYVIDYCLTPKPDPFYKYIFSNDFLIRIGKVSYGIYLFHNLLPPVWESILSKLDRLNLKIPFINYFFMEGYDEIFILLQQFIILYFMTMLSWKYFELPINNLKRFFTYAEKKTGDKLIEKVT